LAALNVQKYEEMVYRSADNCSRRRKIMGTSSSQTGATCCGQGQTSLDGRITQDQIGAVYDGLAPIYDIWGKLTESRARARAIELADIKDRQTVLEVAVGTGLAFYEIVKRNPHGKNMGIDLSKGMLQKAKKRLERVPSANYELSIGTAMKLSAGDGSVDTLLNNYMFDLIPFKDMDTILMEFKRVLKKGGRLVLINMTEGERFGSGLYDFIYNISPKSMGGCRGVKLTGKLQQNGFKVEIREYIQQMIFPSEVIVAYK
jgi:ubiquinone/menaquinone biosynthesis C-methylase UbiE